MVLFQAYGVAAAKQSKWHGEDLSRALQRMQTGIVNIA